MKIDLNLKFKLDSIETLDYPLFESISINVLNTHAMVTTKKMCANSHQFMTKSLGKVIMTRHRKLGKLQDKNKFLHKFSQKSKKWILS